MRRSRAVLAAVVITARAADGKYSRRGLTARGGARCLKCASPLRVLQAHPFFNDLKGWVAPKERPATPEKPPAEYLTVPPH